jgi:RHS repeat-associated protein
MHCMVASSIPCKLSLCADRVQACAGDSYVSSAINVACSTSQSVLAIAAPHELHGDSWPSSPTGTSSFCCNQQYSITAITTSAGAIAERYAYTAYGLSTILNASATIITTSAINNRYTYTGREWDATLGLHHFRARWMSPIAGRFLSRDPIGYAGGKETLYSYCESKPSIRIDPTGLAACTVRLVCDHLGAGKEHCGIESSTDGGNSWTRWHVHSPNAGMPNLGGAWDTCDVRPSRVFINLFLIGQIPLEWHAYMEWNDPTGALCGCIDKEANNITSQNLPYWPVPENGVYHTGGWPGKSYCHVYKTCNSNYSTHCMMKRCGITADRPKAPGWNHRIKDCTEWEKPCWYKNRCRCKTWENIDDDWCAEHLHR